VGVKDDLPGLPRAGWQYLAVGAVAMWLGGFTFYASVVIDIGADVVGHFDQGYITQRATRALDTIAAVMLVFVAIDIWLHRKHLARSIMGLRLLAFVIMLISVILLFVLHDKLDALIDPQMMKRPPRELFRPLHSHYRKAVTFLWCAAVVEFALMLYGHRAKAAALAVRSMQSQETTNDE